VCQVGHGDGARLAREQAEAEAAIAAGDRAVQPTHTATATATTDIPCMLSLQSTSAMSTPPAAEAMRNHHTCANLPAQQRQALDTGGRKIVQRRQCRCNMERVAIWW